MNKRILRAKHWQLFLVSFGIPFIVLLIIFMITSTGSFLDLSFMTLFYVLLLYIITIAISSGTVFAWLWAVAVGLHHQLPDDVDLKLKKFRTAFFIPMIYILVTLLFLGGFMNDMLNGGLLYSNMIAFVIPIHFLSMFCLLYCLYFVAKTIKSIEYQRIARFSDCLGEFFMIWFFPFGIWGLQPKINKMVESKI